MAVVLSCLYFLSANLTLFNVSSFSIYILFLYIYNVNSQNLCTYEKDLVLELLKP